MIGKTNRVEFVDELLMVNSVKCFSQVQKNRTCDRSLVNIIQYSIGKMSKCNTSGHLWAKTKLAYEHLSQRILLIVGRIEIGL